MGNRNLLIALFAVVLGIIAVLLANSWFSGVEEKRQAAVVNTQTVSIVVATQPLAFGTKVTAQNVRLQSWPARSVPQGAFRTIAEVLKDRRVALRPIVPGEPVLADKVSGADGRATLATLLPDGMRAISVPVTAVRGVAGFVLPGTMVDVILTRKIPGEGATTEDIRADVLLSNVQVLAIDQIADDKLGKPKVSRTATLAVSLDDAQRLILGDEMGNLSLVLRKVETAAGAAAGDPAPPERIASTMIGRQITGPRLYIRDRANRGGGGGGGAGRSSSPSYAAPMMPIRPSVSTGLAMAPSGSTMTVFRGAEPTVYPVGQQGGR